MSDQQPNESSHGVGAWPVERVRAELSILRRGLGGGFTLRFPGDGLRGPVPELGQRWERPQAGGRPVRCRVLSVERDERCEFVRFYVGSRRWYSLPGTYRVSTERFRREWDFIWPPACACMFGHNPGCPVHGPGRHGARGLSPKAVCA